jgi:hypothetical protein
MSDNNKIEPVKTGILGVLSSPENMVDDYSNIKLSAETQRHLSNLILNSKAGLVTLAPLICHGPGSCPFISRCPIFKAHGNTGQYPLQKQCIVEVSQARDKYIDYIEEFEFNEEEVENSPTIRSLISKMVECDLLDIRLSYVLAGVGNMSDGSLTLEQTIALTKDGDEVKQLQEHPAFKMRDRIFKQRMELQKALLATPRDKVWKKATLRQHDNKDYLSSNRELQQKLEMLLDAYQNDKKKE